MPKHLPEIERERVYSPGNRFKTKFPREKPEPFDYGIFAERFLRIREWLEELRSLLPQLSRDEREMVDGILAETVKALEESRKAIQ